MVETIPIVGRGRGTGRWASTAFVYLIGSVLAGGIFGAALGSLGRILFPQPSIWTDLSKGVIALVFGLSDLGVLPVPRPQRHEQVPARWRVTLAPEATGGLYGAMLGLGVLTRIPFASFYVVLLWTVIGGEVQSGMLALGIFALARALPATVLSPFLRRDEQAFHLVCSLMPWQRPLMRLTGALLVGVAVVVFAQILH